MEYKVLVIEDDKDIANLLSLYLNSNGYCCTTLYDGRRAIEIIQENNIDIVLVDIMMPEISGYEVIQQIRKTLDIPIIVISAKVMDNDKILGLNLGADAYITKPFNPMEVVAHVKAQLRRYYKLNSAKKDSDNDIIRAGKLELNIKQNIVRKNGEVVPLTSFEYKILAHMMNNSEQIFTKSQLYSIISDEYYESYDNTMMVHISNLRSKIEDDPSKPEHIITVRGLGYRFVK